MKLLWFSPTPGLYGNNSGYNGGGWIASLQKACTETSKDLTLTLVFPSKEKVCSIKDNVHYYSLPIMRHVFFHYENKKKRICEEMKKIVDIESPDAILCFGTEKEYGLISTITDVPVVVHIQGILNPYYETWLPQGLSWFKYLLNKQHFISWLALRRFKEREIDIFGSCKYFLGRTEWDRNIVKLLSPNANYLYGGEILRPEIYNSTKTWKHPDNNKKIIVSIISGAIYKGGDVILRTASTLKRFYGDDFIWNVFGVKSLCKWESITGVKADDCNIRLGGIISASELVEVLTTSSVYFHPSYIENSPNTVCEAQLLGIPTVATNVGGTNSLITHNETGMLVSANDPYNSASVISQLLENRDLCERLSSKARTVAIERHNPTKIAEELIENFKHITENYTK